MKKTSHANLNRRQLLRYGAYGVGSTALSLSLPPWALSGLDTDMTGMGSLSGNVFDLSVSQQTCSIDGKSGRGVLVNGQLPAPLLRWREGETVTLRVTNNLSVDTSIHWHGILLPFQMDGVPGVTFPGIRPNETFVYEFPLQQAGTYWYHSHSGLQEQSGHYGPIIIEPKGPDPDAVDREYVILLSDWTFEDPHRVFSKLKKMSDNYNFQRRTVGEFLNDSSEDGLGKTVNDRLMWGAMRMNAADIADVTGATYTYLINGHGPKDNWTGLYQPGERIRLRFINASAMSIFNVRIPGLPLTVVQSDGLPVRPVETDEFQIGVAETYDVIVEPDNQAYTLVAESNDRYGMARGTLAPHAGMTAAVPPLRRRPTLTMTDMAMDHSAMGHDAMDHAQPNHADMDHASMDHSAMGHDAMGHAQPSPADMDHAGMDHSAMGHDAMGHAQPSPADMDHASMDHSTMKSEGNVPVKTDDPGMDHSKMDHSQMNHAQMNHQGMNHPSKPAADQITAAPAAVESVQAHNHRKGPGVVGLAANPINRLAERPLGLENVKHRVLVYTDLQAREENPDLRSPEREMELHLTSNMERYMWSFDGLKFSEVDGPIKLYRDERVRLTMVNDTMMPHPIHLHGMFFDVVTEESSYKPRKHTIVVKPGEKLSVDITADAVGDWAFHCHLLYHMHAGMMRVVSVIDSPESRKKVMT